MVCRGYALFSGMAGSLPSIAPCASLFSTASRGRCTANGLAILCLGLASFREQGDLLLEGGSSPRPASTEPHSTSCASSLDLISKAWSAIRRALLSSISSSSRTTRPRSSRFSDSKREISFSSCRILCDWKELTLAISRFWRINFLRTKVYTPSQSTATGQSSGPCRAGFAHAFLSYYLSTRGVR